MLAAVSPALGLRSWQPVAVGVLGMVQVARERAALARQVQEAAQAASLPSLWWPLLPPRANPPLGQWLPSRASLGASNSSSRCPSRVRQRARKHWAPHQCIRGLFIYLVARKLGGGACAGQIQIQDELV